MEVNRKTSKIWRVKQYTRQYSIFLFLSFFQFRVEFFVGSSGRKREKRTCYLCVYEGTVFLHEMEKRKKVEREKSLIVFTHPATHIIIKQVHFFFSCPPVHRPPHCFTFLIFLRVEGWNVPKIIKKIQGIKYKDAQRHSTGRVYTHTHVHIFIKNKVCI